MSGPRTVHAFWCEGCELALADGVDYTWCPSCGGAVESTGTAVVDPSAPVGPVERVVRVVGTVVIEAASLLASIHN
jgi:hypothetical protein